MSGSRFWMTMMVAAVAFLTCGCGRKSSSPPKAVALPPAAAEGEKLASLDNAGHASGNMDIQSRAGASMPGPALEPVSLKLIRTGTLNIEVSSYAEATASVAQRVKALGGYVADSRNARTDDNRQSGSMTIRVPAERFDSALEELRSLGKIMSENVNALDVTKEYADLETRLRVKRETADRLRGILRERTARLSDVLEVERELARVTEEIERMEGERRYYDHRIAYSTLTLNLSEAEAIVRKGLLAPVRSALTRSLELLVLSFIALLYVIAFVAPWLVLIAVMVWIVRRLRKRRRTATTTTST